MVSYSDSKQNICLQYNFKLSFEKTTKTIRHLFILVAYHVDFGGETSKM